MKFDRWATLLLTLVAVMGPARAQDRDEWGYKSSEQVKSSVERILSSPEFRHLRREPATGDREPSWLERFLVWLFGELGLEPPSSQLPLALEAVIRPVLYLLVGAAVLLAVLLMVRSIANRASRKVQTRPVDADEVGDAMDSVLPPGEQAAEVYIERATLLAREGDYRAAIREILLGCMSWIERQRLIRYRRGLTCRDYLRAVWNTRARREALTGIVLNFEEVTFGRRQATAQRFEECVHNFQTAFHE